MALAALGALAGVWAIDAAGHRERVLVAAHAVPVGSVITEADLAVAEVYVDPSVQRIPAAARAGLAGKVATADLAAGELLAPGQIAGNPGVPAAGHALTVITLPVSRMPSVGLRPGDLIRVVSTPADQQTASAGTLPASIPATVVRVGGPDASSVVSVDVQVLDTDADTLAARAAGGRIAIVLQPPVAR